MIYAQGRIVVPLRDGFKYKMDFRNFCGSPFFIHIFEENILQAKLCCRVRQIPMPNTRKGGFQVMRYTRNMAMKNSAPNKATR